MQQVGTFWTHHCHIFAGRLLTDVCDIYEALSLMFRGMDSRYLPLHLQITGIYYPISPCKQACDH